MTETATPELIAPEPAEVEPKALYRYSNWVHVGAGAEQCSEVDEEKGTNTCSDSGHFHAFCRLPNEIQRREIRERAQAAKARKTRQLRSQGTDANEILEEALEDVLAGDEPKEELVREITAYDYVRDLLVATREAQDVDDPESDADEPTKLYATIDDDQARFQRLIRESEDLRNNDELEELKQHITRYNLEVEEQLRAIQEPKRASWMSMDDLDLVDIVRRKRIENIAMDEFMYHWNIHEWLSCALRARNGDPVFANLDTLRAAPESILNGLASSFADLERTANSAGN